MPFCLISPVSIVGRCAACSETAFFMIRDTLGCRPNLPGDIVPRPLLRFACTAVANRSSVQNSAVAFMPMRTCSFSGSRIVTSKLAEEPPSALAPAMETTVPVIGSSRYASSVTGTSMPT